MPTSVWIFSKDHHLSFVALRSEMTFEAVLISTLLLAHLTIPSQLLQAFGFDAVTNLHHKALRMSRRRKDTVSRLTPSRILSASDTQFNPGG